MASIFSTHALHPDVSAMLRRAGDLTIATAPDQQTILGEATEADIVIVRAPLPPELFARAPKLRAAIRHGAGFDMIPVEAATTAGVLVANVPGANASTVAEHIFLVAIALLRQFRKVDRDLRGEGWEAGRRHGNRSCDLSGRTLGIVGMGNIGKAVFSIAKHGFGLDVIANSRRASSLPEGARFANIDVVVAEADIVVLCCPLMPETTGLIGRDRIARMKPDALLINVSRGPVIDDDALIDALRDGRIGGAALDVFVTQPLPPDHPYFEFDNVILTPHMAGLSDGSMLRMGTGAAEEALRVLAGALPVNLCNPEALDHYRQRFPAS